MHSYFGVTCYFINNDWNMKQFLLCCKQLKGRHSGDNIFLEYKNVLDQFGLDGKVFKIVTDNASNMLKAFDVTIPELAIDDDDTDDETADTDEAIACTSTTGADMDEIELDEMLTFPDRISFFAHTLQLTVKDGLQSSKQISALLAKVGKIVNSIKKSTIAVEKLEEKKNLSSQKMKLDGIPSLRWSEELVSLI